MKIDLLTIQKKLEGDDKYRELMISYTNLKVMLYLAEDILNTELCGKYKQMIADDTEKVREELIAYLSNNSLDITPTKKEAEK